MVVKVEILGIPGNIPKDDSLLKTYNRLHVASKAKKNIFKKNYCNRLHF